MNRRDPKLLDALAVIYARAAVDRLLAEQKKQGGDDPHDEQEAAEDSAD